MLGNSLPKPQIVLNRLYVRDTEAKTRSADKGEALEAKSLARRGGAGCRAPKNVGKESS